MEVVNKITEEQLTKVVAQQKDLSAVLTNIGILESQKHGFLHQLGELNKAIEDFKSELETEYGTISINLEDGSYTDIEASVKE